MRLVELSTDAGVSKPPTVQLYWTRASTWLAQIVMIDPPCIPTRVGETSLSSGFWTYSKLTPSSE